MTMWQMYWLVKLDDIQSGCGTALCILVVLTTLLFIFAPFFAMEDTGRELCRTYGKRVAQTIIGGVLLLGTIAVLLPSTKQMAAIIVVPKMANAVMENDKLRQLPDKLISLADNWITTLGPTPTVEKPTE